MEQLVEATSTSSPTPQQGAGSATHRDEKRDGPTKQTFSIYELTEHILLQLDNPMEIIRAQRVCCNWRDIIRTSPALRVACWYQPYNTKDAQTRSAGRQKWKLNPAFNQIGVSVSTENIGQGQLDEIRDTRYFFIEERIDDTGDFSLEERIYDKPGSWATMLATQPPCQQIEVSCCGDYSADETMYYLVKSMAGYLLMGDIMAVLAECQNRQEYDLDRWAGVYHYTGQLLLWSDSSRDADYWPILDKMPNDVSIKVMVSQLPFSNPGDGYSAFSLRRLYGSKQFLHEMTLHKMIMKNRSEYQWEGWRWGWGVEPSGVCKAGQYRANLLVIREHQEGYLSDCSHIFRLLSDV